MQRPSWGSTREMLLATCRAVTGSRELVFTRTGERKTSGSKIARSVGMGIAPASTTAVRSKPLVSVE